jgi:hypothetical protein
MNPANTLFKSTKPFSVVPVSGSVRSSTISASLARLGDRGGRGGLGFLLAAGMGAMTSEGGSRHVLDSFTSSSIDRQTKEALRGVDDEVKEKGLLLSFSFSFVGIVECLCVLSSGLCAVCVSQEGKPPILVGRS